MICPHCGAEHAVEQGRFCDACGLPVTDAAPMTCPHCGAAYAPEQGRFCEACGMSVPTRIQRDDEPARPAARPARTRIEDEDLPRCRACGTKSDAQVCPGCGTRMPPRDE